MHPFLINPSINPDVLKNIVLNIHIAKDYMNEEVEKTNDAENNENDMNTMPEAIVEESKIETEMPTEEKQEVVEAEVELTQPEVIQEVMEAEVELTEPEAVQEIVKEKKQYKLEKINFADVKPLDDFDWDSIGKKQDKYSDNDRIQMEEVFDKTLSSIGDHEVIEGTVVSKNNREVVVNIGFKSDGVIPVSEIRYNPDLKIGDTIEVYVESQEDLTGQLLLSHKKARVLRSWERVNRSLEGDEIINGLIKCRTKGGLIVDVFGIEAFLPGSQIDVKPIRDYDVFVGQTMEFKVVKINHEFKNVVVSHKALI